MTRAGAVPTVSQRRINRSVVSGSSSTGKVTVKSSESSVMAATGVGVLEARHQPPETIFQRLFSRSGTVHSERGRIWPRRSIGPFIAEGLQHFIQPRNGNAAIASLEILKECGLSIEFPADGGQRRARRRPVGLGDF